MLAGKLRQVFAGKLRQVFAISENRTNSLHPAPVHHHEAPSPTPPSQPRFSRRLWLTPHGPRGKPCATQKRAMPGRRPHTTCDRSILLDHLLREYLPIIIFLALAMGLGLVLLLAAVVLAVRNPDPEKVSAYECGFNAFDDARMKFDVRFYLVSILFIIFDLEVAFLFPWAVAFGEISMAAFWSMMLFLAVLTVGFAYEWKKGALEWE
jgi:NADH-quinone oxidoreductase subunit A